MEGDNWAVQGSGWRDISATSHFLNELACMRPPSGCPTPRGSLVACVVTPPGIGELPGKASFPNSFTHQHQHQHSILVQYPGWPGEYVSA